MPGKNRLCQMVSVDQVSECSRLMDEFDSLYTQDRVELLDHLASLEEGIQPGYHVRETYMARLLGAVFAASSENARLDVVVGKYYCSLQALQTVLEGKTDRSAYHAALQRRSRCTEPRTSGPILFHTPYCVGPSARDSTRRKACTGHPRDVAQHAEELFEGYLPRFRRRTIQRVLKEMLRPQLEARDTRPSCGHGQFSVFFPRLITHAFLLIGRQLRRHTLLSMANAVATPTRRRLVQRSGIDMTGIM